MKINEVIALVEKNCPGQTSGSEIINLINAVEHRVINEALSRYDGAEYDGDFRGYDVNSDGDRALLAPPPYDEMYVHYVMARIFLTLHEQAHYNNELSLFNSVFQDYKVRLIQTMRPKGPKRRRAR